MLTMSTTHTEAELESIGRLLIEASRRLEGIFRHLPEDTQMRIQAVPGAQFIRADLGIAFVTLAQAGGV